MYRYKKRAMLMQGLIDRSEVFSPLPGKINIFNLEESKDMVNFVYDDEATLPSGRLSFKDWHKNLNSTITHGSRILITAEYANTFSGKYGAEEQQSRSFGILKQSRNLPYLPDKGIYDVELYKEKCDGWLSEPKFLDYEQRGLIISRGKSRKGNTVKNYHPPANKHEQDWPRVNEMYDDIYCEYLEPHLTIMYLPTRETWYRYDERKNKVRFEIYQDDDFVLHWDRLSLEDIDFYLESRVDRPNYLDMMPVLVSTKALIHEEQAKEAPFIQMLVGGIMKEQTALSMDEIKTRVIRCVHWWKWKNMIKRPIDKDDVLAVRMIQKRVLSKNYDELKWE